MQLTQEEMALKETVKNKLDALKQKIDILPSSLKEDVALEYELIKDFMKDKFSRSKHRAKKVFNKKIGGTYLGVD